MQVQQILGLHRSQMCSATRMNVRTDASAIGSVNRLLQVMINQNELGQHDRSNSQNFGYGAADRDHFR